MAPYNNLQTVLDAALKQAGEESSMLLGQTLANEASDSLTTNKATYFADMDDAIFIVSVDSKEEYPGQFYMIFSLRDAILFSGLLLGIPPARISEKRKLAILEVDDIDAFSEIMNQIIGSFNSVLKPNLPNKVHLKLLTPKKFVPGIDDLSEQEPLPDGEFFLFRSRLLMEGQETDRLDILMPVSLANLFDPPAVAADTEATAEAGEGGGAAAAVSTGILDATILFMEEDEQERQQVKEMLLAGGFKVIDTTLDEDVREIVGQAETRMAIIGLPDTEERELAHCVRISSLRSGSPLPVIICARQWTRTAVLKALKYGARDIIVKPYQPDELVSKVNKTLKAA